MNSSNKQAESPIAADIGARIPMSQPDDPYQALDELMVVVEALCPVWFERKGFVTNPDKMLL